MSIEKKSWEDVLQDPNPSFEEVINLGPEYLSLENFFLLRNSIYEENKEKVFTVVKAMFEVDYNLSSTPLQRYLKKYVENDFEVPENMKISKRKFFKGVREALTGSEQGPAITDLINTLGKEEAKLRILRRL